MYKCLNCGEEFETPGVVKERMPDYWGSPAYQDFEVCPCCGGDFEKMYKCDFCGEWTVNADWICDDCMETAKTTMMQATDRLAKELNLPYNRAFYLAEDAMEALDA